MPRHFVVLCFAVWLHLAAMPAGDAADCQGQIGAGTSVIGKTVYDPYSPIEVADFYDIGIVNTGAEPCSYALVFKSRAAQPKLGDMLVYRLADRQRATSLGITSSIALTARLTKPVAPSETARAEYAVIVPRGQYAPPGSDYRDVLDVQLHGLDVQGSLSTLPLQTATLSISYAVSRVLSVNIKGGGSATTLNMDTLVKGKQRTVEIQARSNQAYRFEVSSEHRGALALTPAVPGQSWTIPYLATLGGQRLDLAGQSRLADQPPTRPESDAGHVLAVTIGDTDKKRAGRYEDIITIDIKAALP
jgi:hypothetical protein